MTSFQKSIAILCVSLLGFGCQERQNTTQVSEPERTLLADEVVVSTGRIRGFSDADGLHQFHGIPYAAPPVGDLRWAPPVAAVSWEGVRDASAAGPACMQPQGQGGSFYGRSGFAMDEDCLTLNVWSRAASLEEKLPVMVWVHGGALVTGAGSDYPGHTLTKKGVVLVTINYRLGRFGFHAHPELSAESALGVSGNQGLRDQILALEWVQDNISSFGGDPENVTIFGESAGSLSMSLLQASPLAAGLFHRVIGQSGGAFQPMWFRDQETTYSGSAEALGVEFGQALAGAGDASLAAQRAVSQTQVLEVFTANPSFANYDSLAIVDGDVIPDEVAVIFAEGRQADVPVLVGSNANEGTTFLPFFTPLFGEGIAGFRAYAAATLPEVKDQIEQYYSSDSDAQAEAAWADMFGDVVFAYPMRTWARSMENVRSEAYLYWFTWAPPVENSEQYGAFHAGEIGYIFGDLELFGAKPVTADVELADLMASIWAQFARTGNPNGPGLPQWPEYSADTEAYMELGVETGSKAELRIGKMDLVQAAWQQRRSAAVSVDGGQ